MLSRSFARVASTAFLILVSLLPYTDIFLGLFFDTSQIKTARFPNLDTAIWSYSTCITPMLLLAATRFKPYWFAYLVPCYVYITMFCGFLFLDINIYIASDWLFRIVTLSLSFIVLLFTKFLIEIYKAVKMKEDIIDEMIKLKKDGLKNTNR